MNVDISPSMISWAQTARYDVTQGSHAHDGRSVLYTHGGELRVFVGLRPDHWIAVTESERMGAEYLLFAATSMSVTERWLLGYFGPSIRYDLKLPRLNRQREVAELASGYEIATVSFDGRPRSCLVGPDGQSMAVSVAGEPVSTSELVEMSNLASVPFDTIAKAFLDETGQPLFRPKSSRRANPGE